MCGDAQSLLTKDGAASAGALAVSFLASADAGVLLEAILDGLTPVVGGGRVSVLVPEAGGVWRVFASSSGSDTHDLLIDASRYPELSEVRRTRTPFVAPDASDTPELRTAYQFLRSAGVKALAAFPIFTASPSTEPVVLKLSFLQHPTTAELALATLAAHQLVHRLRDLPLPEVAKRLGMSPPPSAAADPSSLLRLLPLAAMVVHPDGRVIHSNALAERLLRRPVAPGDEEPLVLTLRPEHPWEVHGSRWEAQVSGAQGATSVLGWSSSIATDRLLVLLEPHPTPHRRSVERRMRRTLADKLRELEAANALLLEHARSRGRFVSDAAHELKTPLAILRSYLDTLNEDLAEGLSSEQREFLGVATHGARRLQRLVDELLDLAALESGHLTLSLGPVSSEAVVASVIQELQPLAANAGVLLVNDPSSELTVRADNARLRQVLRNLVENGLKYTRAGGEVEVSVERRGDRAVLSVRDNGAGIPAEALPRIFDEFLRLPGSQAVDGAGLGLAIVRRLALAMGGRVWAESVPGTGSRFSVELPLWTGEG